MASSKSQDAIALLKEDHREVKKLFKEFEAPSAFEPSRFAAAMRKAEAAIR